VARDRRVLAQPAFEDNTHWYGRATARPGRNRFDEAAADDYVWLRNGGDSGRNRRYSEMRTEGGTSSRTDIIWSFTDHPSLSLRVSIPPENRIPVRLASCCNSKTDNFSSSTRKASHATSVHPGSVCDMNTLYNVFGCRSNHQPFRIGTFRSPEGLCPVFSVFELFETFLIESVCGYGWLLLVCSRLKESFAEFAFGLSLILNPTTVPEQSQLTRLDTEDG
jgi:hypothetical protein